MLNEQYDWHRKRGHRETHVRSCHLHSAIGHLPGQKKMSDQDLLIYPIALRNVSIKAIWSIDS